MARARAAREEPAGLAYRPDFMSADEERGALDLLGRLEMDEVVLYGQKARRTVRHFGLSYDYAARTVAPTDPLPGELEWLRERCAALAEVEPPELAQVLVLRYPPGATIGWHRDAPMFGRVVGVSLGTPCRMRFQRSAAGGERRAWQVGLEPRSAYLMRGAARWTWQHSIPPTPAERWSITFRTLREER